MQQVSLPQVDYTPFIIGAYALCAGVVIAYAGYLILQRIKIRKQLELLEKK